MLDGKLRIAPTCYHVLHLLPVMAAHEMNFFYDAGLKTPDGSLGYQILRDAMVPFGLESFMEIHRPALTAMAQVNGKVYDKIATMNKHWVAFVNRRLEKDFGMPKQLAACKTVQEMYGV